MICDRLEVAVNDMLERDKLIKDMKMEFHQLTCCAGDISEVDNLKAAGKAIDETHKTTVSNYLLQEVYETVLD